VQSTDDVEGQTVASVLLAALLRLPLPQPVEQVAP